MKLAVTITFAKASSAHSICVVVMTLLIGSALPGCVSGRFALPRRHQDPMAGAPRLHNVNNPPIEEVVAHLNRNIDRVQSWRADNVKIQTGGWSLSGKLAVEKDRRVRLFVSSPMGNEVDLGSNDERFWVWSRRMEPGFVTCKHENMEVARQKMGVPFEPDWLMQALGVSPLPTTNVKLEEEPHHEQARIVQQVISAHGLPLRRVVLVDLKRGIVLEHSLYDYDGIRIAQAKLSGHWHDKATGVVMPRRVLLDWPQNQMSMTMDLGKVQINPKSIPSQIWEMPEMPGYDVVNLDSGMEQKGIVTRPSSVVRIDSIEETAASDEEASASDEDDFTLQRGLRIDQTNSRPGRARISTDSNSIDERKERDWDQ